MTNRNSGVVQRQQQPELQVSPAADLERTTESWRVATGSVRATPSRTTRTLF
jgi:hypothetical protein